MAEALIEAAAGAVRALVLEGGTVLEAHVERADEGPRPGDRLAARLAHVLVPGVRGIARLPDGTELLLAPLPAISEGALLGIEVTRAALHEAGRPRLARARPLPALPQADARGPDLAARLAAAGHRLVRVAGGADRLAAAGWDAVVEEARSGLVPFAGGLLTIVPTPAMTTIDIDGDMAADALAMAAVPALAAAIRRLDLQGSIAIDFPSLKGPGRKALDAALMAALGSTLQGGFEVTALNGFGLVQLVRPRRRASLVEAVRAPGFAALELLRRAARAGHGPATLVGPPAMIDWLASRPRLLAEAGRQRGGALALRAAPGLAMVAAHVE